MQLKEVGPSRLDSRAKNSSRTILCTGKTKFCGQQGNSLFSSRSCNDSLIDLCLDVFVACNRVHWYIHLVVTVLFFRSDEIYSFFHSGSMVAFHSGSMVTDGFRIMKRNITGTRTLADLI